ncbi:hypothetical protein SAMN02799636_01576 [Methylobacterium sp. 275MFSha3.1]|uniref:hypothetical protein n=1 Tax=Methylobacterium sp. 275MFSha3.1 TaxID=1502746 RepID=UPI0008A76ADC|nr:hypothetical protein [Methylobacterium sp. 275MFSha3.1]SEH34269.1 hypothetical protein SAMN02799636_01576 [Methylobacterium sp. 275MFSha3.1]
MIRAPRSGEVAASNFALCSGFLSAMVVDGHSLEELAAHYQQTVPDLRARLVAHVAACRAALEIEAEPAPVAAPTPVPPEGRIVRRRRALP